MKQTEIEISRAFETPTESETHRILREARALLGPNGERWVQDAFETSRGFCARGAINKIMFGRSETNEDLHTTPYKMLLQAVIELDPHTRHHVGAFNNDQTDFAPIDRMFARAMELA